MAGVNQLDKIYFWVPKVRTSLILPRGFLIEKSEIISDDPSKIISTITQWRRCCLITLFIFLNESLSSARCAACT